MYMMPEITELVFSRSHNSTPLRQLAESGFPALLISGASDAIIDAQVRYCFPVHRPPSIAHAGFERRLLPS
jgi:hypothetical protein